MMASSPFFPAPGAGIRSCCSTRSCAMRGEQEHAAGKARTLFCGKLSRGAWANEPSAVILTQRQFDSLTKQDSSRPIVIEAHIIEVGAVADDREIQIRRGRIDQ